MFLTTLMNKLLFWHIEFLLWLLHLTILGTILMLANKFALFVESVLSCWRMLMVWVACQVKTTQLAILFVERPHSCHLFMRAYHHAGFLSRRHIISDRGQYCGPFSNIKNLPTLFIKPTKRWHIYCVIRKIELKGKTGRVPLSLKQTGYIDLGSLSRLGRGSHLFCSAYLILVVVK